MSEPKVIEVRSDDPAINSSIVVAADLASRDIPFVAVPCITPEQADAAALLGKKHFAEILQMLPANH
ncbi:hypothetical protein [Alcaligenes faecalis]|uniref:Uncharacterized protein n=1 Tax=Alcaligenes faecalis TaxID=511 RepID=A0ABY7N9D4_ALCFA|nr:hypothetical protein [Alcaligenes faecalis]WBM40008.1 hypothetical protein M2J83_09420 [Alcaligenes faecalis]